MESDVFLLLLLAAERNKEVKKLTRNDAHFMTANKKVSEYSSERVFLVHQ